jgi:FAD/FMN-containing dehydrogenase
MAVFKVKTSPAQTHLKMTFSLSSGSGNGRAVGLITGGIVLLLLLFFLGRPVAYLGLVWLEDEKPQLADPAAGREDFGRFDHSLPHEIVPILSDPPKAEQQLIDLVLRADQQKLKISISGASHSMGGHTLFPGGVALDMLPFNRMSLDEKKGILTVGAGARWSEIIPFLDQRGFAVDVMQSNNDFSIGGSLSVNCHGWRADSPPIASTVESFRLVTAEGKIVRCSRTENPDLFSLAQGGYGLFGIILDVNLRVIPNEFYRPEYHAVKPADYAKVYDALTSHDPNVGLAYGRISIAPDYFLNDAYIIVFKKQPAVRSLQGTLTHDAPDFLARLVFRGSVGSDYGKNLCWQMQTLLGSSLPGIHSRNQIMNVPSEWFANRSPDATEILHEYFIPPEHLADFIETIRPILLRHKPDLLNITVRKVKADSDTFLRYAPQDRFALVMYFHQQVDAKSDQMMESFTRDMIDAALSCGGTYYLPYRPHATSAQFMVAYPQAAAFFEAKRKYDPYDTFENQFYVNYGKPLLATPNPK